MSRDVSTADVEKRERGEVYLRAELLGDHVADLRAGGETADEEAEDERESGDDGEGIAHVRVDPGLVHQRTRHR
jgi:hypothetical protein